MLNFDDMSVLDDIFSAPEPIQEEVVDVNTESEISDEVSEEVVETTSEYEYPEFVPDDLRIPTFENPEEELNWYKNNYTKTFDIYNSEKFASTISDKYADHLFKSEKDYDKLIQTKQAFESNPELMFKLYYPEELVKNKIAPTFTEEEVYTIADKALQKEFGVDYKEKYDVHSLSNPNSLSAKMFAKQQEVLAAIKVQEEENNKKWEAVNVPPEVVKENVAKQRKEYFNNFDDNEFNTFLDGVKEWQYNLQDIHRAMYFDDYAKAIYEDGLAAGKKQVVNEFKGIGKKVEPVVTTKTVKKELNFIDDYLTNKMERY